ncbi:HD domain-containing protein, partial [Oxalobacter sp. OttesenSCG-928-P03]|nr:HD domain-containing protein [Oxalobacter sp. OttesenSCG-928-P03]
YLARAEEIARYHHERWDGRGYPDGLAGNDIPLTARILSVVDVYDALVNVRCYKPKMPHEEAVKIIMDGKGTQFDPIIADAFYRAHQEFAELETCLRGNGYNDNGGNPSPSFSA